VQAVIILVGFCLFEFMYKLCATKYAMYIKIY